MSLQDHLEPCCQNLEQDRTGKVMKEKKTHKNANYTAFCTIENFVRYQKITSMTNASADGSILNHMNHQIQELDNCIAARKAVNPQKERTKERTIYPTRPLGLLRARRLERPNPIRDSNHLQKRALHRQR